MGPAQDALNRLYRSIRVDVTTTQYHGRGFMSEGSVEYPLNSAGKNNLRTSTALYYDKKLFGGEKYTSLWLTDILGTSVLETNIRPPEGKYETSEVADRVRTLIDSEVATRTLLQNKGGAIRDTMKDIFELDKVVRGVHIGMDILQLTLTEDKFELGFHVYDKVRFTLTSEKCSEQAMNEQQTLLAYQTDKLIEALKVL